MSQNYFDDSIRSIHFEDNSGKFFSFSPSPCHHNRLLAFTLHREGDIKELIGVATVMNNSLQLGQVAVLGVEPYRGEIYIEITPPIAEFSPYEN